MAQIISHSLKVLKELVDPIYSHSQNCMQYIANSGTRKIQKSVLIYYTEMLCS